MFGHKRGEGGPEWEPARGTILESRIEQTALAGEPSPHNVRVYVVRVRKPDGGTVRATVPSPYGVSTELSAGLTVRLQVEAKTGEVRFDPSAPALEKIRPLKAGAQAQAGVQAQAPGVQAEGAALPGPAGSPGRAGAPAGSVGFSSPDAPSTFDRVSPGGAATPAANFSSPAGSFGSPASSVGPPGGSVSFSSPALAPPSFEPATPAAGFGSPAGGSFSAGGSFATFAQDSKSDRIARLQDQRDRGQLTRQQFEARRQQIMDEI